MSESSKMGLFGSKDDNTGGETSDGNNEPPSTNKNSPESNTAPYNIDSDSETYDTEALSIMDINDIIGVQAETAGDSTLESEFAALSEVITNCKGEFSSKNDGAPDCKDNTIDTRKDSQPADKQSHDSTMASISKSLQLIGEAYISEDSQETDTEETSVINAPKLTNFSEHLRASKNESEDGEKIVDKQSVEHPENSGKEMTATEEIIVTSTSVDLMENVVQETEEPKKCIEESPKSPPAEISVDSTDSVAVDKSIEKVVEDKTEDMDVDCSPRENIIETPATENQSDCKTESSEENIVDNSHIKTDIAVIEEQPMEVDQVNEEISTNVSIEKSDYVKAEEAVDDDEKLTNIVPEETKSTNECNIIEPEESKNIDTVEKDSIEDKISSETENVENLVAAIIKTVEPGKIEKVIEKQPLESFEKRSSPSETIQAEKFEMETDDSQIEDVVDDKVLSKEHETIIETSIEGMSSALDNVTASPKREKEPEKKSESLEKPEDDMAKENLPIAQEIIETEPMEVDDNVINTQPEIEQDKTIVTVTDLTENHSEISESAQDNSSIEVAKDASAAESQSIDNVSNMIEIIEDKSSQNALVQRAADEPAVTAILENSSTSSESIESKTIEDIALKENPIEESVASLPELCKESLTEELQIVSMPENESKISRIEESLPPAAESNQEPLSTVVSSHVKAIADSALDGFGIRTPTQAVDETLEDEKMEVDGTKREENDNESCQPEAASQQPEESASSLIVPEISTEDITEGNSTIGKAVESDISEVSEISSSVAPPEIAQTEKTIQESIQVPIELPSTTTHEKETTDTFADDNVSEDAKDKKDKDPLLKEDLCIEQENVTIFVENTAPPTDKTLEAEAPEKLNEEIEKIQLDESKLEKNEEEKDFSTSTETSEPLIVNEAVETVDDTNEVEKNEDSTSVVIPDYPIKESSKGNDIETPDIVMGKIEELRDESEKKEETIESHKENDIETPDIAMGKMEEFQDELEKEEEPKESLKENYVETPDIAMRKIEEFQDESEKEEETKESLKENDVGTPDILIGKIAEFQDESETKEERGKESLVSTEVAETSMLIEAATICSSAVKDKNEDVTNPENEPKEEESSIITETAVCDNVATSVVIDETVLSQTTVESDINVKNNKKPTELVSALETQSQEEFSEPYIGCEVTSVKDVSSALGLLVNIGENPVDEEINVPSPDAEIVESSEKHDEKAQSIELSLPSEPTPVEPEIEINNPAEMNLSPNPEEKIYELSCINIDKKDEKIVNDSAKINTSPDPEEIINELPNLETDESNKIAVEDCVEESSMTSTTDKLEDIEERFEKPCDDIDDNSKDAEPTTVSVPEIFHDEQSQTTQEMMESILETDTGNINKILDDEEAEGEALARSNALALESAEIDELSDKLPSESEELLNKELDDPMSSQNIDSLERLLDLDLMPESNEPTIKIDDPIVDKVMNEAEEDVENTSKDVDVSLLLGGSEHADDYSRNASKGVDENIADKEIKVAVDIEARSMLDNANQRSQLASPASELTDNDLDAAFDLSNVVPNPLEAVEENKMDLDEELLREIAVDEERKMELAQQLFLESSATEDNKIDLPDDILLETTIQGPSKIDLPDEDLLDNVDTEQDIALADPDLLQSTGENEKNIVLDDPILLQAVVPEASKIELSEDISLESAVRDHVLTDVVTEIEDLAPSSEISELESAVKFLQESEEQDIESPLELSPKLVESVVDDIAQETDVGIFSADADMCEDPSELVAELESIIPDPIAISEAEIISEAAKLESERKTKEEAELQSPIVTIDDKVENEMSEMPSPLPSTHESFKNISALPETPKTHRESRETVADNPREENIAPEPLLKKSVPIPKMSILEERLKIPPKIEIPVGEISRICEMPTTPKTSLLIQRDAKLASYQKMLESPKGSEKSELKIVDTPRKDSEKHDFDNVGSPRIILKIAKSAIADCGEPRSPKSPKIRSATNSPNPDDSPGQKLGKIKLKLSKSGHPSIIPNDNIDEICGQWHTEGTSSLSPLGMKIKFSKTGDASIVQTEKHESVDETKEQPKHKFEEAKRTESPIGMKIKLSRTGDPSIVQQDAKETAAKHKDKLEIMQGSPKRTESPIGMKIKLSKSGDASIIQPEKQETDEHREGLRVKDKLDVPQDIPRRTESPLGMKIKLFKTGDASIVQSENVEDSPQDIKRTDSPLGMKIKLSKTRGASIIPVDSIEESKEKLEVPEIPRRTESPLGMKFKLSKSGDASIIHSEESKETTKHKESQDTTSETSLAMKIKVTKSGDASIIQPELPIDSEVRTSSIGMKIKLSKTGDASIVHSDSQEQPDDSRVKERIDKADSSIGMKIKLSKTGDASIIHKKSEDPLITEILETEHKKSSEAAQGMKIKLQKSGDASLLEIDKKDKSSRRKDTESPLEMKIKLSKTGHPTIIACDNYGESSQRSKDSTSETVVHSHSHKHKESLSPKENAGMKMLKTMQSTNLHGSRSELTIEPIQLQNRKTDVTNDGSPKRKEVTISPIESKKAKLEAKLSQMLPEVTIQPITPRDQKKMMFDAKASSISRQQMNVISQEISITQVRPNKPMDLSITDKLKSMLTKNTNTSVTPDCEIIERHPELIIVNENSNSSQEVMIIEEVPALRGPDAKIPKKRGRPRRNPLPLILAKPLPQGIMPAESLITRDPLALDDVTHTVGQLPLQNFPPKENERPKRTCSRQKSYAPPRRGRGRGGGRGKRKMEMTMEVGKKPRIDQDLDTIERSTTALITIDEPAAQTDISHGTSELYKALRQPPMDAKITPAIGRNETNQAVNDAALMAKNRMESIMDSRLMSHLDGVMETSTMNQSTVQDFDSERKKISLESICGSESQVSIANDQMEKSELLIGDDKIMEKVTDDVKDVKDVANVADHQNWLTPSSKKLLDGRNEGNMSNVQVIDEETRMSAESGSRSQTPARNMSVQAPETIVNEESQGSVLSTATTESEKVKVKNRRMEINFDPDEGPFTVDKVAEYEWPPDPTRKSETFMIQEQISQYLGVKSFKRKYPDLKRRMVDMEERNFLRENGLVSEAMCDMGLTAVSSSEVLDVMCSDFPDQYEEYRKYIRDKQMKEHSKKQKELTAAANAERNRIDLAEMAVQSALSWNVGLNKARRESRKCSLDLQTFTIHVPKKQQKVEEESKVSHYPVALIPGQYTDYYREYTPAELRYYPLNTVLYGPMKPNERKFDSQSEGSQSDSDSDSSSDDSSSSSSDGTQDTEESQSTMDEVDVELSRQKEDIKSIKCKMCLKHLNKFNRTEVLIQCGTCNGYVHPSCIDLTLDMVPHIQAYAWQCTDCKTCAQCHDPADEDKMLFCDMCDRGYHIYCVGLRRVPQGRWHCQECAVCASCGSREAGGANSDRNSVAQWQHEYKKGDKNTRVYVSTLCVPCSKLWRKGRYCPHCSRCHTVPRLDLEANLVHCSACDKYLHLGCVETKDLTIDRKNYLCDFCQPSRQQMVKPLVSKVFRT